MSHTYYNNLDSRRIKSQEIPRLALIQAFVGVLNTEKRERSHVSIVITTVNHFTVLIPKHGREIFFPSIVVRFLGGRFLILGSSMNMNLDHLYQYKSKLAVVLVLHYFTEVNKMVLC